MTARPLDPAGRILRQLVLLRRYENTLSGEVADTLTDLRDRLVFLLERQDVTIVAEGRQPRRYASVAAKADEALQLAYARLNEQVRERLVAVAALQAKATGLTLGQLAAPLGVDLRQIAMPTRAQLRAIVTTEPVRGAVMWDWWKRQRIATRQAFQTQVRLGMSQGESIDDIVRRVRGRALGGGRYEGGVLQVSTRNAQALVRTSVTQVSNQASFATYAGNDDLTQEYEYVATLDVRTTEICMGLDGQTFRYDDKAAPRPPQHWGCRSTIVPVIDWKAAGLKPPATTREQYPAWFDRQPASVQDLILGPGRARLVRAGQISLGELVRDDGSRVTLAELEDTAA